MCCKQQIPNGICMQCHRSSTCLCLTQCQPTWAPSEQTPTPPCPSLDSCPPRPPAISLGCQPFALLQGGCDASLLLDIAPERAGDDKYQVEKLSGKNDRMRLPVFTLLDDIKAQCESRCLGVVSAADILTAATW
jgi:hypothetical protein